MPRVSAGSVGPGWGCTCPSRLKKEQILTAMARASRVTVEYRKTEPDGTMIFFAYTDPMLGYRVTFNPDKPGKVCKHAMACSSYIVGDWLTIGFNQLREEMEECQTVKKVLRKLQKDLISAARAMLSDTS